MNTSLMQAAPELPDPHDTLIYLDREIIVINKPAGLLSIQDGYDRSLPHLATYYQPRFGKVWIIHRLDKETSGVVLLGRNADAHRFYNAEFQAKTVNKHYHCLVASTPGWEQTRVNLPLRLNADRLHRTRVDEQNGKPASTGFRLLAKFNGYSLLECELFTGYTHQIRAHLFAIGLHLLGETLYCEKSQRANQQNAFGMQRIALHARTIAFTHCVTHKSMQFTAPYPLDMQNLLSA